MGCREEEDKKCYESYLFSRHKGRKIRMVRRKISRGKEDEKRMKGRRRRRRERKRRMK